MITLENIEKKLGFDPTNYHKEITDHSTGDNIENPYSKLSSEELDYLLDYFTKVSKSGD